MIEATVLIPISAGRPILDRRRIEQMDYTERKTQFGVKIRKQDRRKLKALWPGYSLPQIDILCKLKATQREAMELLRCTNDVLDCCVEGIPSSTISQWAESRAKRAA